MAPVATRNSFVAALPSQKKGQGHLLSGSNGLRKTIIGTTLADAVMTLSKKPLINYDKCKVSRRTLFQAEIAQRFAPFHGVRCTHDMKGVAELQDARARSKPTQLSSNPKQKKLTIVIIFLAGKIRPILSKYPHLSPPPPPPSRSSPPSEDP
jgi:hypothetical protein